MVHGSAVERGDNGAGHWVLQQIPSLYFNEFLYHVQVNDTAIPAIVCVHLENRKVRHPICMRLQTRVSVPVRTCMCVLRMSVPGARVLRRHLERAYTPACDVLVA